MAEERGKREKGREGGSEGENIFDVHRLFFSLLERRKFIAGCALNLFLGEMKAKRAVSFVSISKTPSHLPSGLISLRERKRKERGRE